MKLVIPGKTFLVGEYAVLVGGNALGLATAPYFESTTELTTYHASSAAGLFLRESQSAQVLKNNYHVGGFGFSTAEFVLAWFKKNNLLQISKDLLPKIFSEYRNLFDQTEELKKTKPSGADLIIQLLGGVTYFNPDIAKSQTSEWIFPQVGFDIISTGLKIKTHEHLSQLDLKCLKDFPHFTDEVIQAYFQKNVEAFFENLKAWIKLLQVEGLQHNSSIEIVNEIRKCQDVILAKPNGAMGADTITVFYKLQDQKNVRDHLAKLKVLRVTNSECIALGAHYVD